MRACVLAAIGTITSSATAGEIAAGGYHEIFAQMFASPRGLEVLWQRSKTNVDPKVDLVHGAFSANGDALGEPETVIRWGRRAAQGPNETYAIVNGYGFDVHITAVAGPKHRALWDAMLPHREWGYESVAVSWDPRHGDWIVVASEQLPTADRHGFTHRLLEGRLDAHDGGWLAELAYFSPEGVDAQISDIGTPLVWAGDHAALAWTGDDKLYVTEFLRSGLNRLPIAHGQQFTRVSIAASGSDYVLAGETADHHRVFVARGDRALRFITPEGVLANCVALASDGEHVAIAWSDSDPKGGGTAVRAAVLDKRGSLTPVFVSKRATWVTLEAIAWTPSGLAVLYATMLNTPDDRIELAIVPPHAAPELAR